MECLPADSSWYNRCNGALAGSGSPADAGGATNQNWKTRKDDDMNRRTRNLALLAGLGLLLGAASRPSLAQQPTSKEQGMHEPSMHGTSGEEMPGHAHQMSMLHGGVVAMTKGHRFETVFGADGLRIYMYSGRQVPARFAEVTGTALLKFKDGRTEKIPLTVQKPQEGDEVAYFCPGHPQATQMHPGVCDACGGMPLQAQNYLLGNVDLAGVQPGSLQAVVDIRGLGGDEPDVTFTETYEGMMGPDSHRGKT